MFKAIESAIPTTAIDRVIAKSTSRGQLNAKTTCPVGCMFGHRYEFVVQGSDAGCFEESSRWIECAMDAPIAASGKYPTVSPSLKRDSD